MATSVIMHLKLFSTKMLSNVRTVWPYFLYRFEVSSTLNYIETVCTDEIFVQMFDAYALANTLYNVFYIWCVLFSITKIEFISK